DRSPLSFLRPKSTKRPWIRGDVLVKSLINYLTLSFVLGSLFTSLSLSQDLSFQARREVGAKHYPASIAIGDIDRDGNLDLVSAEFGSSAVSVFFGNTAGGFEPEISVPVASAPIAIALADFNGDGHLDIAVANWLANSVSILMSDGRRGIN